MNMPERSYIRALPAAAVLVHALAGAAAAQQPPPADPDTFRLAPVTVTATRLPTPLAAVPGTITVLTGADLRQRGIRFVSEALRLVPGVNVVQTAGPGGLTSVFIRGGESDYVQVLVDGVPANDAGGAFNWAHLRADDIERIEVVRGPASVLYGSDAVTGVVQIFTRAGGAPRIEAAASTHRGSRHGSDDAFATHAIDASVAGSTAVMPEYRVDYGLNAGRLSSTGIYAFNSDYASTNLSARLLVAGPRGDFAVTGRHTDNTFHYPTTGAGAVVDPNQFATGRNWSFGGDAGYRISNALELRLQATSHSADSRTEDPADNDADGSFWNTSEQSRRRLDARTNWRLGTFIMTGGADREWQHGTTEFESISQWGTFTDESDNERSNTGVYAQLHGTAARNVSVTAGARVDDNSAFGTFHTARVAVNWAPLSAARLHVAAGTAFKEPTFFENYATGFTRGNPELRPEQSRSWEAGAEYALYQGRATIGATWFDQRFRDLIQYTAAPASATAPNYSNIGSATARGLEVTAALHATDALRLDTHYTLTRTIVHDAGFGTDAAFQQDQRLLRRPEHLVVLGVNWLLAPTVRALLDVRYVGDRDDLDFTDPAQWSGVRTTLEAYTTVDAGVLVDVLPRTGMTLSLRVRNAFDTDYVEIYNFPRPGRVLELGVRTRVPLR
jgi:vitamin B12 transporter